jgi:hypothetical protein
MVSLILDDAQAQALRALLMDKSVPALPDTGSPSVHNPKARYGKGRGAAASIPPVRGPLWR